LGRLINNPTLKDLRIKMKRVKLLSLSILSILCLSNNVKIAQKSTMHRIVPIAAIIIVALLVASLTAFYYQSTSNQLPTKLSLNISLNQSSAIQGTNLHAEVNVTSIGKAEKITLTSNSGSSGLICTFEPSVGKSNFTSALTIYVPDSTPRGNYIISVTAFGNGQEQNASFTIPVLSANVTVSGSIIVYHLWIPPTEVQFINAETHVVYKAPINNNSYCISLPVNQTYGIEGDWNGRTFNGAGLPMGAITMQLYGGYWLLNLYNVTSSSITQNLQVG
jgi:hypothetical protein